MTDTTTPGDSTISPDGPRRRPRRWPALVRRGCLALAGLVLVAALAGWVWWSSDTPDPFPDYSLSIDLRAEPGARLAVGAAKVDITPKVTETWTDRDGDGEYEPEAGDTDERDPFEIAGRQQDRLSFVGEQREEQDRRDDRAKHRVGEHVELVERVLRDRRGRAPHRDRGQRRSELAAQESPKTEPARFTPGKVEKRTYDFKDAGKEMEYAQFVPTKYDKDKKELTVKEGEKEKTYAVSDTAKFTTTDQKGENAKEANAEAFTKRVSNLPKKGALKMEITIKDDKITEAKWKAGKKN